MHPRFDDPLFGGEQGQEGGLLGNVPPGARYDPTYPGDPQGNLGGGPGTGRRGPGAGGPGGPGGFGGFGGFSDFI
jgi:PI31 proteasome regulator